MAEKSNRIPGSGSAGRRRAALLVLAVVLVWPSIGLAQLDICGCAGAPGSLGAFDSSDPASYPPGTTSDGSTITIPLPADGVLLFDSVLIAANEFGGSAFVRFGANAANTPVTLLAKGDVTISNFSSLSVDGQPGTNGTTGGAGVGGLGGPGGFAGGDGASQALNLASEGGTGFGPAGGTGGTPSPLEAGADAIFLGVPDLLPAVGGSGGGGGASSDTGDDCAGGGGGGGGGAILIAANGTIAVEGTSTINALGGFGGSIPFTSSCASNGGRGSGGAVRLVANAITGTGRINAGGIRLEAFTNTLPPGNTTPAASRSLTPGPLANPLAPKVVFTAVNGQTQSVANGQLLSQAPQGVFGVVDVVLPAPGVATFDLATSGVPSGTTLEVTVKPRIGGGPVVTSTTLDPGSCDGAGDCVAAVAFDLPAGAYVAEAQATFETP